MSICPTAMNRIVRTALAVALSLAAAACVMQPPKTAAEREADKDLVDRVDASLKADPGLYARHINLRADNGVVTHQRLCVDHPRNSSRRSRTQSGVPGVVKVVNRMEVDRGAITDSSVTR